MSGGALIWAANVRGLKPATKIVLIQLSERHNKDTGQCNPSIKTLAEDCEMDRTTVMAHLKILESLRLIEKHATGGDGTGRKENSYLLHMPKQVVTDVSDGAKSEIPTRAKSDSDGGLSRIPTGAKSDSYPTRTLREPEEEPYLSLIAENPTPAKVDHFAAFWAAFPKKKGKGNAEKNFAKAVKDGADPERIVEGAKRFAVLMRDVDEKYIKFPEGWLSAMRWEDADLWQEHQSNEPWRGVVYR